MQISHSKKNKYVECPRKFFYHYIQKLRSPKLGSALFFGNALDDAFSRMLLDKKPNKTPEELTQLEFTPEEIFSSRMLEAKNEAGQIIQIAQSELADYYSSDFDASLFTAETISLVSKLEPNLNSLQKIVTFHEHCKTNLSPRNKNKKRLSSDEMVVYNYINWLSLNEKGKLMLEAYKNDILPKIDTVFSIQKEIAITNEMNDVITGKIDLVASFGDRPKVPFICDNKTASKAYSDDSVAESEQLATYCEAEQNFNAAYLVVQKEVFKNKPKIRTQIIKDTINEQILAKTFDNYEKVCNNIEKAGEDISNYPKNESSCYNFGKACSYLSICKYNNLGILIDCNKPKEGEK